MLCVRGRRTANLPGASGGYLDEIKKGATKICLSGCSIETNGAQAIIDAVKCNLTIKTVYLFGNQHDLEEDLKQALAGPRKPPTTSRRISALVFRE
ncbi:hypothetical protein BASA81_011030 [Batrachochytrium salamandrivorans]|nr:hypothetical protein BASA81_011030 [Batrachochytrium salamandrivorans]